MPQANQPFDHLLTPLKAASARDDSEYGRLLQQAVAGLKDGHVACTRLRLSRRTLLCCVGADCRQAGVATVAGNLPELSGIQPGMELLEIDGTPAATVIERDIDPYTFSRTIQDRQLRWMRQLLQGPPGSLVGTKWLTTAGETVEYGLVRNGSLCGFRSRRRAGNGDQTFVR